MSTIFLIEPHRVLQQAIALALFPEHEVRLAETADASAIAALKNDIDLVIVDAAALRASDQLFPEINRAIEAAPFPIIWLDDGATPSPKRDKLAAVVKPIERAALQAALADLLAPAGVKKERKAAPRKSQAETEPELIDLTEVVEGESPTEKRGFFEKIK